MTGYRVFALLLALLCAGAAQGQTTKFTYQGRLSAAGTAASGSYDLQFALFDSAAGGTETGTPQVLPGVTVSDGLFTVQLDFGADAFPGADRFLEIEVRPAGGGSFTTLAPRQQISSSPYAIRTLRAASADALSSACVGCVQDAQISAVAGSKITGTIPAASLPAGSYIQNTPTQQAGANFNVSGNGTVGQTLAASAVGVGTATPVAPLDVMGTGWFQGDSTPLAGGGKGVGVGFLGSSSAGYVFAYDYGAGVPQNLLLNIPGGNVGIGTTTPAARLHISGSTFGFPFNGLTIDQSVGTALSDLSGAMLAIRSIDERTIPFNTSSYFLVNSAGNVGIGTAAPASKLHVSGSTLGAPFNGVTIDQTVARIGTQLPDLSGDMLAIRSTNQITFPFKTTSYLVVNSAGGVGIGTGSPTHRLTISGGPRWTSAAWTGSLELDNAAAIAWQPNSAGNAFGIGHTDGGLYFFHTASGPGNTGSGANYDLTITDAGHVSVNVLDIQGGADVSETFDVAPGAGRNTAASLQPGLLVSIDPEHPGKLRVSDHAYDRRVAGVISGAGGVAPGMIMGQAGSPASGRQAVALNGRVYCWADARRGAIAPGDLLTTSDTPGHAMRVRDSAKGRGAVIGKAMTELRRGRGLVLVLLALQ